VLRLRKPGLDPASSPDYGQRLVRAGELTATIVTPPPTASAVELVLVRPEH
jgi:hypothetical protein